MKRKTILISTATFVILHFFAGLLFFYAEHSGTRDGLAHMYAHSAGIPADWLCIGFTVLWFPAGPLSSLFWGVPVYAGLRLLEHALERPREGVDHEVVP